MRLVKVDTPAPTIEICKSDWKVAFKVYRWSFCAICSSCSNLLMWLLTCTVIGLCRDWPQPTCQRFVHCSLRLRGWSLLLNSRKATFSCSIIFTRTSFTGSTEKVLSTSFEAVYPMCSELISVFSTWTPSLRSFLSAVKFSVPSAIKAFTYIWWANSWIRYFTSFDLVHTTDQIVISYI